MVTHMDDVGPTALAPLLREADTEAERTTGWVRIALALALAGSLLISARIVSVTGYDDLARRIGLAGLAIGALLALGVASLAVVYARRYASWMAFVFTAADATIILSLVWVTLRDTHLNGNWIAAVPAVWAAPLILAMGPYVIAPVFSSGPQGSS